MRGGWSRAPPANYKEGRGSTYARTADVRPLRERARVRLTARHGAPPCRSLLHKTKPAVVGPPPARREDQLRRPGRDSDEPGHPLPIYFHQDRFAGLLGFLELLGSHLGAVDHVLADLLQHVARLQALVIGQAAPLDLV